MALLVAVGTEAAVAMDLAHDRIGNDIVSALAGMIGGMGASMVTALILRPVLGSIETTVPAMAGGMLCGFAVCVLLPLAAELDGPAAAALGAVAGFLLFAAFLGFDRACRTRLEQRSWQA